MIEARWYHSGYSPSLEEYLENAWISIGTSNILIHGYFLTQHGFKMEDMVRLEQNSNIIRFSKMIVRLANDLGTYKVSLSINIRIWFKNRNKFWSLNSLFLSFVFKA